MNPKNFFYPNQYFNKKIGTFEASRDAQNAEFLTIYPRPRAAQLGLC
jgi:hypothetical protein